MATTFDRTDPLGGLPPKHILEDGGYSPVFTDKLKLEEALGFCKTTLENNLKANINLVRVSAPLFVTRASGFNDNLNVSYINDVMQYVMLKSQLRSWSIRIY